MSTLYSRGTYWANYATGLGASMHELGHCFDLAHTPKGIMGRGFDDMHSVWSMWRKPPSSKKDLQSVPGDTGFCDLLNNNYYTMSARWI